ncbi:MAG TPA: DUF2905 domain-containing protein [Candidatus Limnocylindria bacterium]|jgi:hypothetical protein|nr:DUF2905 domain-containing protein [Candidatus Limnocylindria bacterium]
MRETIDAYMDDFGRALLIIGVVIATFGLALMLTDRVPLIGKLPGDVAIRGDGWVVYAPIATSIIVSLALTALFSLFSWLAHR